jgi:hypothetical protein
MREDSIMKFADILNTLPEFSGEKLILSDAGGEEVAVIANAPGTAGSFRVYAHLAQQYGVIDAEAAAEGLAIFAEHTEEASRHPGRHPNVDRLIAVLTTGSPLKVRIA